MELTLKDVEDAYRKLKNYVYYDKTLIHLRNQVANFEAKGNIERKLKRLHVELATDDLKAVDKYLSKVGYKIIPKTFKKRKEQESFYTNVVTQETYDIEKVNYLIDAPIELHIVSVLWIKCFADKLETPLSNDVYGYRHEVNETKLFTPYFISYSAWRDNAINKALELHQQEKDIVLIGLDLKSFYPSVRLNFKSIRKQLGTVPKNHRHVFNIIEKLHHKYHSLFVQDVGRTLLPIGLLTSGIIANWHLRKIDRKIKGKLHPQYYGRYVDDILLVTTVNQKRFDRLKRVNESLIKEEIVDTFFIRTGILKRNKDGDDIRIVGYDDLRLQSTKFTLLLFEAGSSVGLLEQFKKNIEENSSEFNILPDEELLDKSFQDSAYQIVYDDSINKLRSVKELNHQKFEITKYLSKLLFRARFSEARVSRAAGRDRRQIVTFFRGRLGLEFFQNWERVFTFLVLKKQFKTAGNMIIELEQCISRIRLIDSKDLLIPLDESIDHIEKRLKVDLISYLSISLAMPIALNLAVLARVQEITETKLGDKRLILRFSNLRRIALVIRNSNMFRHEYASIPLSNYTRLLKGKADLSAKFLNHPVKIRAFVDKLYNSNSTVIKYSPRLINFDEIVSYFLYSKVLSGQTYSDFLRDGTNKKAVDLYFSLNGNYVAEKTSRQELEGIVVSSKPKHQLFRDKKLVEVLCGLKYSGEHNNEFKIGIANTKVNEADIEASLKGRPNIEESRQDKIFIMLNEAVRQRCKLFVMPEVSVPHSFAPMIRDYARKNQIIIVCGFEHFLINGQVFNLIVTFLPFRVGGYKFVLPRYRLKNHYSPEERKIIEDDLNYSIPKALPYVYDLFNWWGVVFSTLNCFEIADIKHRSIFRSEVDFLTVSEFNRDVNYFSNIVESASRDIHCYVVQVNNSLYGDSRITRPSDSATRNIIQVKGGENDSILTATLQINTLRTFQVMPERIQEDVRKRKGSRYRGLKLLPPDFDRDKVRSRMRII